MPRLILIDPALVNTVGHHHEFAHNVLSSAAARGWTGALAGNQQCRVTECGGWPVRPAYRDGLWTHQTESTGLKLLSYAVSAARRSGPVGEPVCAALQQGRDAWRARRFAADTARLLREVGVTGDDILFLPNATATEVDGVRHVLSEFPQAQRASWHLEFHFNVFPRAMPHRPEAWRATRTLQAGLRRLLRSARNTRLFLYTDTEELTNQYEALQAGPFYTLPIPVDPVYRVANECPPNRGLRPLRIAYVGDARGEKGYPQIPDMIAGVWDQLVAPGIVQFAIQSNCRASRSEQPSVVARQRLAERHCPAVELLTEPLSTEAYRALVLNSDVLLLPYDPDAYEARSSGILSEALAAGKPVVVPEGTWMAEQLREPISRHKSELLSLGLRSDFRSVTALDVDEPIGKVPQCAVGVVYPAGPAGMAQAVREVVAHFEHYQATARSFSGVWTKRHDPQVLVATLGSHAAGRSAQDVLRPKIGSGT